MADPIDDIQPAGNFNPENIADLVDAAEEAMAASIAAAMVRLDEDLAMPLLHLAAKKGFTLIVEHLLAEGTDANIRHGVDEESVLDLAAMRGFLDIMRLLLEHGVDANSARSNGQTTLHAAVCHGRADIIDLLISAGADVNALTLEGLSPLHFAAGLTRSGDAAAILLRRGADKDALTVVGITPLHVAAQVGNLNATRALLAAGADETLRAHDHMFAPLDAAAQYGQVEAIRVLARHGVDLDATPDTIGFTALHSAAQRDDAVVVAALVEAGASVAPQLFEKGITPLHSAAEALALEAMAALLQRGAPVLALPVQEEEEGSQEEDTGVAIRTRNESPLHIAARQGGKERAAEAVDLLLKWGADESELDNDGKTAAEVVGADVSEEWSLAADADRVLELLARAPANRAWRRHGLLLMCLARERRRRGQKSGGKGKEGLPAKAGDGGVGGGSGSTAMPSCADFGVRLPVSPAVSAVSAAEAAAAEAEIAAAQEAAVAAMVGPRKRETTPVMQGCPWADFGSRSGTCSSRCVGSKNKCRGAGRGSDDGLEGVVTMLLEFEEEGFFRTIVGYL